MISNVIGFDTWYTLADLFLMRDFNSSIQELIGALGGMAELKKLYYSGALPDAVRELALKEGFKHAG